MDSKSLISTANTINEIVLNTMVITKQYLQNSIRVVVFTKVSIDTILPGNNVKLIDSCQATPITTVSSILAYPSTCY